MLRFLSPYFLLLLIITNFILLIVPPFIDQVQQSLYLFPLAVDKIEDWLIGFQSIAPEQLVGEIQKLGNLTRNLPELAAKVVSNFYEIFFGIFGCDYKYFAGNSRHHYAVSHSPSLC